MANQKYNPPNSQPPPAYGSDGTGISSPAPAHVGPQGDYYGVSPYQANAIPYGGPPQHEGYPPTNNYPPQGQGGYYTPGPQMYQQGPGPQGGYYGPQQGYGPQGQPGYYPQYGQQGGYHDNRRGGSSGFMEAMLASLACCCCLDACLLF